MKIILSLLFILSSLLYASEDQNCTAYKWYLSDSLSQLEANFQDLKDISIKEPLVDLLLQARINELNYPDYYHFFSAQDSLFFAYQTIAKELYRYLHGKTIEDFEFLRYPASSLIAKPSHFLEAYNPSRSKVESQIKCFDGCPDISYQLISASLSMDTYAEGDSALFVLLQGKGITDWKTTQSINLYNQILKKYVSDVFKAARIPKERYQPYLRELINSAPRTKEGIINHILIPKDSVESYLYMAFSCGIIDEKRNENIRFSIKNFQDTIRFKQFFLEENIQVRILAGSLFDGQVKIFRYSLIPAKEQEEYRKLVRKKIMEMFLDNYDCLYHFQEIKSYFSCVKAFAIQRS